MNKRILLALLSMIPILLNAQDKIITQRNDTIDCKIKEVTRSSIFFESTTKGVKIKNEIDRKEVKAYLYNETNNGSRINASNKGRKIATKLQKIQLGVSGGYSYLTANSSAAENQLMVTGFEVGDVKKYYDSYREGTALEITAHKLFFNNKAGSLGLGVNYLFDYRTQQVNGYVTENMVRIWSNYEETIYTNFAGISVILIKNFKKIPFLHFYIDECMGLNFYRNEMIYFDSPRLLTAVSYASKTKYGFQFEITPALLLDVNAAYFYSMFSNYRMNNGYSSELYTMNGSYELLSKGILSVGLKYNFTKKKAK